MSQKILTKLEEKVHIHDLERKVARMNEAEKLIERLEQVMSDFFLDYNDDMENRAEAMAAIKAYREGK